jgi:hypothetical protein
MSSSTTSHEARYRAALQAIIDYEPSPPILTLHNKDCEECRRLRALPFLALCSRHYQQWLASRDECAVVDAALHHELRAIARKALEEPEP